MPQANLARRRPSSRTPPVINLAEEEDIEDYGPGGYLNVKVGDDFVSPNRRHPYITIRKLGCILCLSLFALSLSSHIFLHRRWGHFSTVWLVLNQESAINYASENCTVLTF